jgi:hypothetical protein
VVHQIYSKKNEIYLTLDGDKKLLCKLLLAGTQQLTENRKTIATIEKKKKTGRRERECGTGYHRKSPL